MNSQKFNVISLFIIGQFFFNVSLGQGRIAEKVYFQNEGIKLEGILIRPDIGGKLPVVVFQQGSGGFAFEGYEKQAWGPHKFYIEDLLLEQGYAVLYCNKRGLGGSEGNWKHNDFYGRAGDAYAAVKYLKTRPDIDGSSIGISGHSQGGWVAQITAAQHDDIAFVIALAGPTVGIKGQTESNDRLQYACDGLSGEKLEKRMAKRVKFRKFSAGVGRVLPFIASARYWYLIADYDHEEVLRNINCPTLLLFAEHDINVNPEENIAELNRVFQDEVPSNFTSMIMEGGQHGFYKVSDQCVDWNTASQQPFDDEFQDEIRQWILMQHKN